MKRPPRLSLFQLCLLALGAAAVGSLYTPYPARLVRALRSKPQPAVKIVEKIVEVPVPAPPQQPPVADAPAPPQQPQLPPVADAPAPQPQLPAVADDPARPWEPESLLPMPAVQLPPFPPALPERVENGTFEHIGTLARGLNLRSTLTFLPGSTASQDRLLKEAYLVTLGAELLLPHAAEGRELLHANPDLPAVLPQFDALMSHARVSPWFHSLYLHKQNHVRKNLSTLSQPLDRHNFFDTDTILELTAPDSQRRALWIQADMDIVSDGSDGDRLPNMPDSIRKSDYYQPTTSYRWKKRTKTPNPLLSRWESRLASLQKAAQKDSAAIDHARRTITDLKNYSYLLAQYDPFIVIPLTLKEGEDDTYRPQPGDYAVVIVGKRVVPAIVGDYGPRFKTGEASLRLGKLISEKADIYSRPVSTLGASYIIFPHTAEPEAGPINHARLNARCRELLSELGGLGAEAEFVETKDLLAPPTPSAAPAAIKPSSASPIGG